MNKSNYFFITLGTVYLIIAISACSGVIVLDNNVLFGLALSSLFIAIGGLIDRSLEYILLKNEYKYYVKVTSDFLQEKIDVGAGANNQLDVFVIKETLEEQCSGTNRAVHPGEYEKRKSIKHTRIVSTIFFIIGISVFIFIPFAVVDSRFAFISNIVTVCAFAIICFEYHMEEKKKRQEIKLYFFRCDKQAIVNMAYPDYMVTFDQRVWHKQLFENVANCKKS